MIIKNVKAFVENKTFVNSEIMIDEGRITNVSQGACTQTTSSPPPFEMDQTIDGNGCYAIPGLIDLHFHGCKGFDLCDGTSESIAEIAKYEASVGVMGICPATMTLPVDELIYILSAAASYRERASRSNAREADLLGINMEGPFISAEKKGAQDARHIISCDTHTCRQFLDASRGLVTFIGVAPERNENALAFIREMKQSVHISLAHTIADYDTAMAAFGAGADHVVHLYNAMPAFSHRQPGVVGAVADSPHVTAELICDGVHIHPSVVRATFRMLGDDRIVLISDSMRATGMPDGRYMLGGLEVKVTGNRAELVSDGALAGSATNLMDCMRTAVKEMDIPLASAVACASMNPAKALGVFEDYGSVTAGKKANIVLLDADLSIKMIIKDGVVIAS